MFTACSQWRELTVVSGAFRTRFVKASNALIVWAILKSGEIIELQYELFIEIDNKFANLGEEKNKSNTE